MKTADPIAAYMDAVNDAEERGCCDSDVLKLQYLGDSIALFAHRLADIANSMADGRMRCRYIAGGVRRQQIKLDPQDVAEAIAEAVFGDFESYDVIKAAMLLADFSSA